MSSVNRNNNGYVKRKNILRIGFGVFQDRHWCRRLHIFCQVSKNEVLGYLFSFIPATRRLYSIRFPTRRFGKSQR